MSESEKPKVDMSDYDRELKEKLELLWTVYPKPGEKSDCDQFIEGLDSDDVGATRLMGSGESQTGSEVRIRFRGK